MSVLLVQIYMYYLQANRIEVICNECHLFYTLLNRCIVTFELSQKCTCLNNYIIWSSWQTRNKLVNVDRKHWRESVLILLSNVAEHAKSTRLRNMFFLYDNVWISKETTQKKITTIIRHQVQNMVLQTRILLQKKTLNIDNIITTFWRSNQI